MAGICLVHGTPAGEEALGILSELARVLPAAGQAVRRLVDRVAGAVDDEAGLYSPGDARLIEHALGQGADLPVWLFSWSSENHHLGRADGAVRLIDELAALGLAPGQRVLLWGHSHGGNVLAIVSNLLGGDRRRIARFFDAAEIYYRWPLLGCVDVPVWQRVRTLLLAEAAPLRDVGLDVATFGTPIRYGWDPDGYSQLLHFIHHRPAEGLPAYRAPFPPRLQRVVRAADRDYVQQLGIAGTNVGPSVLAWRAWMADQRLGRLLQPELVSDAAFERFRAGAIVPDEGVTLLVDYGRSQGGLADHLAGHAVYTQRRWLLFHLEQIVQRFYARALRRAS